MLPRPGEQVEFVDLHAQTIVRIEDHLDDVIIWLKPTREGDPEWVMRSELMYVPEDQRWFHTGNSEAGE